MTTERSLAPIESISATILTIRGQKVILDSDLARLYGTPTKVLNQAVKRNADRFPDDFMFQLTEEENESLRSQFVTLESGRGKHRKYLPYAFTEHGALMASTILYSPKAVEVSVYVVRAFIQQRAMLAANAEMSLQLERLERKLIASVNLLSEHDDAILAHESQIEALIEAINEIRAQPSTPQRPIGFQVGEDEAR